MGKKKVLAACAVAAVCTLAAAFAGCGGGKKSGGTGALKGNELVKAYNAAVSKQFTSEEEWSSALNMVKDGTESYTVGFYWVSVGNEKDMNYAEGDGYCSYGLNISVDLKNKVNVCEYYGYAKEYNEETGKVEKIDFTNNVMYSVYYKNAWYTYEYMPSEGIEDVSEGNSLQYEEGVDYPYDSEAPLSSHTWDETKKAYKNTGDEYVQYIKVTDGKTLTYENTDGIDVYGWCGEINARTGALKVPKKVYDKIDEYIAENAGN